VCYEILTGVQPFEGEKMGDLFNRITVDQPSIVCGESFLTNAQVGWLP
jgi:hypothetical protein